MSPTAPYVTLFAVSAKRSTRRMICPASSRGSGAGTKRVRRRSVRATRKSTASAIARDTYARAAASSGGAAALRAEDPRERRREALRVARRQRGDRDAHGGTAPQPVALARPHGPPRLRERGDDRRLLGNRDPDVQARPAVRVDALCRERAEERGAAGGIRLRRALEHRLGRRGGPERRHEV